MPTGAYTPADIVPDPLDFTAKYNTPLPAGQQAAYIQWAKKIGQDPVKGRYDYDLQGAFLNGASAAGNGHLTDQFKKPNHPTFSDQSQYSGLDGYTGGTWADPVPGVSPGTYQPSQTNLAFRNPAQLQKYFAQTEPDTKLLPALPVPKPTGKGGHYTIGDLMAAPASPQPISPQQPTQ